MKSCFFLMAILLTAITAAGGKGRGSQTVFITDTISDYLIKGDNYILKRPADVKVLKIKNHRDHESFYNIFGGIVDFEKFENSRYYFYIYQGRPSTTGFIDHNRITNSIRDKSKSLLSGWTHSYIGKDQYVYDYTDDNQNGLTIVGCCNNLADTTELMQIIKSIRIYRDSNFIDTKHETIKIKRQD